MTSLFIDTSIPYKASVRITAHGTNFLKESESKESRAQMILPLIKSLLDEHEITLIDITDITVVTGPGSFTGLRVGATISIILSKLLSVPLNGNKFGTLPTINYGKDLWKLSTFENNASKGN